MTAPPVTLRAPEGERELHFVQNSWTDSQTKHRPAIVRFDARGRPLIERMDTRAFVAGHCRLVDQLLARARVVAAGAGPGLLAGWLCYEPHRGVHYLYVDHSFRRLGIARLLLEQMEETTPKVFSHWTPAAERLFQGWTYDPTIAWTP